MMGAGSGPEKGYVLKVCFSSCTVASWAERPEAAASVSSKVATRSLVMS
jgi:hypothetical protein